jgi:hypothetical protein
MLPMDIDICFYHGNCHDGALSAAILKQKTKPTCEFVPTWWDSLPVKPHLYGKNVVFVDLTPSPGVLAEVLAKAARVFIVDHHESARATLLKLVKADMVKFDVAECGSTLAWQWANDGSVDYPPLVKYIRALDMFDWSDIIHEDPQAMNLSRCIEHIVSPTVVDMEAALRGGSAFLDSMRAALPIADNIISRQIDKCLGSVEYFTLRHVDRMVNVAIINVAHFINHVAHRVYSSTHVHLVWVWYRHGSSRKIRIMLRSNGQFDCQRYATMYGGGGHPNAAMFVCDRESAMWEHMYVVV